MQDRFSKWLFPERGVPRTKLRRFFISVKKYDYYCTGYNPLFMLVNIYRLDIFNGGFPVSGMIVGDFPHDNKWYLRVFGSTLGGFLSSVLRGAALRDVDPPLKRW